MVSPEKSDKNSKYSSVFLSYSSEDADFVEYLAQRLENAGVKYWLDNHELNIGNSLFKKIGFAIKNADFFSVIWSNSSSNSNWVEREINIALGQEINVGKEDFVLPILLENIPLHDFLSHKVHADFTLPGNFETSFERLLKTLLKEDSNEEKSDKFYPNNFIPELEYFVGRTKLLEDLKNQLKITHRASIHDISGLGKTFTTYRFAQLNQDAYEKIFFVRANKEEMMQSLAEIGVLLNLFLKDEQDQSKQALGFKKWLEENDNWLVIYDNVDIPVELYPYVPLNKKGDCLFTSNFSSITRLGDEITINKLDKDDAESLLFSRANDKPHSKIEFSDIKEQKAFENIVREIDGHPLSLNTTGAFISGNFISFAEFDGKMKRTPDILVKNEDGFDKYQNQSALKAFSIAIDDISVKKDDDEFENSPGLAQKLLFAASIIAPDNIPEQFLRRILTKIAEIDFEAEENTDLWLEIRRKMLAYDLLKYDRVAKTFKTHRLIQKVIQTKQSDDEKKTVCNAVSIALDELFPHSQHETKDECEIFAPHAVVLIEIIEKACLSSEEIANIYHKIALYLLETIKYQDSIEYFKKAIDYYKQLFGHENKNIATCLNNLAIVYHSQREYIKAIELYNEALEINVKTIGKQHKDYATQLNNLADVYRELGRYDEAIEKLEEALKIDEKTIGKEHPQYATRLNILALIFNAQSRYDEALEKLEEALKIDEKSIGKEHPDYAKDLNNLALIHETVGKCDKALSLYEEALKIFEEALPENHPNIQQLRESVARCREMLGEN